MNRIKALFIADRIMTRIEADKAIHKDAIADEIQAAEVIDVISYDENKKCWVFRDGTPIEPEAEQVEVGRFSGPSGWFTIHNLGEHEVRFGDTIVPPGCTVTLES